MSFADDIQRLWSLIRQLQGAAAVPAVTLVSSFSNSWVNFDSPRPAAYYRIGGRVYLQGIIKDGTMNTTAFTLPSGYRPSQTGDLLLPVVSNGAFGLVVVETDGDIRPNVGSNVSFVLEGVSFRHA